ncbi:unnamed protein product [Menidia menidia]|uniref:Coronin n=1 Tax=Menidia menidia TaxID=238744 RepID=A0A8S4AD61_9TELE|nr:unnamed protein product [Menidia menidia]
MADESLFETYRLHLKTFPPVCQILIWNLEIGEPVKMIDCHTDVILSMSFNTDGSLLATSCKDKKLRVIEPRSGRVLQEDLSMPIVEEDIDGLSGLLFPFYDADTHMLYLAGKGDGNIRYFEMTTEKPYIQYLTEFRSPAPQKGLGESRSDPLKRSINGPQKRREGIRTASVPVYRRRSESGRIKPALSASEWLSGIDRDPVLMSLKDGYNRPNQLVFKAPVKEKKSVVVNGIDLLENVPPRTENELLRMFFRQQDELRRLKEELTTKDVRIRQLELELNNLKNVSPNNV